MKTKKELTGDFPKKPANFTNKGVFRENSYHHHEISLVKDDYCDGTNMNCTLVDGLHYIKHARCSLNIGVATYGTEDSGALKESAQTGST